MKIQKILNESKNVGDIYHFTPNLKIVYNILSSGELISSNKEKDFNTNTDRYAFSFTRDRNIGGYKSFKYGIIFDGTKLSDRYKINPFRFNTENLLMKSVRHLCKCGNKYFVSVYQYSSGDNNSIEKVIDDVKSGNIDYGIILSEEIYNVLREGFLDLLNKYNNKEDTINRLEKSLDMWEKVLNYDFDGLDMSTKLEYQEYSRGDILDKEETIKNKIKKEKKRKPIIYKKFDNGNEVFIFSSWDNVITGSISLQSLYEKYGGGNLDDLKKYLKEKTFDDKEERVWFDVEKSNHNFTIYKNHTGKHKNSEFEVHLSIKPVKKYVVGFVLPKKEYEEVINNNIKTNYLEHIVKMFPRSEYKYLIR